MYERLYKTLLADAPNLGWTEWMEEKRGEKWMREQEEMLVRNEEMNAARRKRFYRL